MKKDNLKEFNMEVKKFAATVPGMVTVLQKKIVLEALSRIVLKTPVDTGRARGNWQVTIGQSATDVVESLDKDGQAVIAEGMSVLITLPPYSVVWISNNLEYIEFLEEGSSKQAPHGMVVTTIEELMHMFK